MNDEKEQGLTHIREDGSAVMVDISEKQVIRREAVAIGTVLLQPATVTAITESAAPKGDVLAVARIAGIQACKKTSELIPLCHQLPLTKVEIDFSVCEDRIEIICRVRTDAKTGVEMEALTGVSAAALTIYDMCKAIDQSMQITGIVLKEKTKTPLS